MVPNPAQMFELTRLGKAYAYIEAPVPVLKKTDNPYEDYQFNYRFDYGDVTLYSPTEFVHAALEDTSNRSPEKVELFLNKDTINGTETQLDTSFSVKRGQSILYNLYKIWRQKQLLEDAILLNRVTKSSLVRILNIEIGDMDKNKVPQHVQKVKQLVEQKTAINTGMSMSDYTNPGPVENTIYIPTRNGIGKIESQEIGTNITDVKNLADLDYFNNLLFGALRVPKQFFAQTDDSTGFNGGTSLTIISSRYARTVKRVQNVLIQAITDILNLFLMDSGLDFYVNKFTIKMAAPLTQEEIDKKDNESKQLQLTRDIHDIIGDNIEDKVINLKLLKALLSTNIQNQEVLDLLQDEINKLEKEEPPIEDNTDEPTEDEIDNMKIDTDTMSELESSNEIRPPEEPEIEETSEEEEEINLESPNELNIDMTQNV